MVHSGEVTTAEAAAQIERIPLDPEMMTALQDPGHPGHRAASARRRALYSAAYRETAPENENERSSPPAAAASRGRSAATAETLFAAPAGPKDYRFDPLPHGLTHDSALEQKARGWFHQAGVPHWLARNIVREWNRAVERQPDAQRTAEDAAATERKLRQSWGDKYEPRIAAARSLVGSLGEPEVVELLDLTGLANSEYLIRQLAALAESRRPEGGRDIDTLAR